MADADANTKPPALATRESGEMSSGAKHGLAMLKVAAKVAGKAEVNKKKRLGMDGRERGSIKEAALKEHQHGLHQGEGLVSCNTFLSSKAQHFFDSFFSVLGLWIAKHYLIAQAIGFMILIAGLPGTFLLDGSGYFLWIKVRAPLAASRAMAIRPRRFAQP